MKTEAEIRAEVERRGRRFGNLSIDQQRIEAAVQVAVFSALEWVLSAPATPTEPKPSLPEVRYDYVNILHSNQQSATSAPPAPTDEQIVEAMAMAIEETPRVFVRCAANDDCDEICRYGSDGELEIVILARVHTSDDCGAVRDGIINKLRARAALAAYRKMLQEQR